MAAPRVAEPSPAPAIFVLAALALGWAALSDMGFRDSGELGTAGFGLGVPHPTGFAVDVLLLRAASLVPLGSVAFRQNLCVALEAALAVALLAGLCDRLALRLGVGDARARFTGAAVAAAALLSWLTFLGTALGVEVYSLALAATALAARYAERGGAAAGGVCAVIGLGLGLHVTAGFCAVLLLASALAARPSRSWLRFIGARAPAALSAALVVAYLPLASLRDPALDWGDPQTFSRLLAHLSAARIRDAYAADMLASDPRASLEVIAQLLELWPILPLALLAVALGLRRAPAAVLVPALLLAADLAYAVWINPMGAVDRQVGHVAGSVLALLAGIGAALLFAPALRSRVAAAAAAIGACALGAGLWLRVPRAELGDGYAATELFGSGGPLAALPPRALLVCQSDDACAGGLFALHVERVRPDVEVLPAQHLWDRTVLRRLRGVPAADVPDDPAPAERASLVREVLRAWLRPARPPRPLRFEGSEALRDNGYSGGLFASQPPPYFRAHSEVQSASMAAILVQLDRLRSARLRADEPSGERARFAWSRAYGALGEQAQLGDPAVALRAQRTAAALAPARAVAHTNLGVALEANGDPRGAEQAYRRAIELAPLRPAPWVNLARLTLQAAGPAAAREVLALAESAGVKDPRLDEIGASLQR